MCFACGFLQVSSSWSLEFGVWSLMMMILGMVVFGGKLFFFYRFDLPTIFIIGRQKVKNY